MTYSHDLEHLLAARDAKIKQINEACEAWRDEVAHIERAMDFPRGTARTHVEHVEGLVNTIANLRADNAALEDAKEGVLAVRKRDLGEVAAERDAFAVRIDDADAENATIRARVIEAAGLECGSDESIFDALRRVKTAKDTEIEELNEAIRVLLTEMGDN